MKPLLASLFNGILCLALIGVSNLSIAQGNIQADARLFVYETPDQKKYVEFYLSTLSASLSRSLVDGHKGVAVQLICTSNGDITFADKYNLIKSTNTNKDLYHVQRIPVKEGSYTFDITLADHVDSTRQISKSLEIDIPAFTKEITMSSIQLLGNVQSAKEGNEMAKNGLVMEPLKFNFLNLKYDALQAYFEVYRTSDFIEKNYLLRYDIIHMAGNHPDTVLTRYKRRTAVPVDPILIREVNDTTWTSGKYQLAVSLLDYDQNVLAKGQETFILSNPRKSYKQQEITQETIENSFVENLSDEELIYSLKALTPKVDPNHVERLNHMISQGSEESKKSFLYGYWANMSSLDPEAGYTNYMKVVRALDNMFYDGLGHGFETDRGYIYLKYGRPDHMINIEDEPTAPPYQIWTYTEFPATRQNNVKFVFYNPASTTYDLLHSNARGEVNDPQWLVKLYSNSPEDVIGNTHDATQVKDYWNRRAAEYFNDN